MQLRWNELLTATLTSYAVSAQGATQGLIRNWVILPAAVALYLGFVFLGFALSGLGILGGFILNILALAALSLYYHWLSQTVTRQRIRPSDLKDFDVALFFGVISVSFVLWIATMLVAAVAESSGTPGLPLMFSLLVIFACNSLPEVLYLHRAESVHAFQESFRFVRDNAIEWYVPLVLVSAPFLVLGVETFVLHFASSYPLLPISMIMEAPRALLSGEWGMIASLGGLVLAHWFMLFRAHLFQALSQGTRRQRAFLSRQK
jgi:hypothetical protein